MQYAYRPFNYLQGIPCFSRRRIKISNSKYTDIVLSLMEELAKRFKRFDYTLAYATLRWRKLEKYINQTIVASNLRGIFLSAEDIYDIRQYGYKYIILETNIISHKIMLYDVLQDGVIFGYDNIIEYLFHNIRKVYINKNNKLIWVTHSKNIFISYRSKKSKSGDLSLWPQTIGIFSAEKINNQFVLDHHEAELIHWERYFASGKSNEFIDTTTSTVINKKKWINGKFEISDEGDIDYVYTSLIYKPVIQFLKYIIDPNSRIVITDLFCRKGNFIRELLSSITNVRKITGVDIDSRAINYARNFSSKNTNYHLCNISSEKERQLLSPHISESDIITIIGGLNAGVITKTEAKDIFLWLSQKMKVGSYLIITGKSHALISSSDIRATGFSTEYYSIPSNFTLLTFPIQLYVLKKLNPDILGNYNSK